jgi:hypothetical protein
MTKINIIIRAKTRSGGIISLITYDPLCDSYPLSSMVKNKTFNPRIVYWRMDGLTELPEIRAEGFDEVNTLLDDIHPDSLACVYRALMEASIDVPSIKDK